MTLVICIITLSYALIAFEVIIPGGLLGVLGFMGLIAAAYLSYLEFGGWFAPSITFLASGIGALALILFEFKWLSKSPLGQNLFLSKIVEATSNTSSREENLIGCAGISITDLHPEGLVEVNGKEYDASSESGFLPKNVSITVTGIDDFTIRVKSVND
jgi:membrane-bound ClpP family serine protease